MLNTSLDGIRVIDFSQIGAGPTCSMYLGDMGADVIKIESPSGDLGRTLGRPWVLDESPIYVAFNRNKRSIVLNLKSEAGLQAVRRLAASADVLIESFRPGVMSKLGLGHEDLKKENPGLVYCSVSAFGQTGPATAKPGVDGIIQGESGLMSLIGFPDQEPCKVQAPVVDVTAGIVATVGVLAALFQRERKGEGEFLDVSLFASAIALQQSALTEYFGSQCLPIKAGSAAPYAAPNEAFEASDGWLMVAAYNGGRWERLCEVLGIGDAPELALLANLDERVRNRALMRSLLQEAFAKRTVDEWLELLSKADIICGSVATYRDLERNPQMAHLKLVETLTTSTGNQFRVPAFPINSAVRQRPSMPPPDFGEHTVEILREAGYDTPEIEALLQSRIAMSGAVHA
ncbi:CaiB/BaiF CoA transferase family protein [Paracandidimonas soli]|uniref:Crotonobetainyl-CoA:carnitine CoA-transferase CaiB-like acyl-CoA transferase n=1 Tax=Paracandidimonas soli TaxID=1917182 RepID=A0A4R3V230_9BURK|nr:CoA transferase [Paracandidimonas soli]TCU97217.1 crotonobetainyl-CoA:carnitine CoA-transferase CaiB-like acyl-CoA transferase [Paracandidimonas soli]